MFLTPGCLNLSLDGRASVRLSSTAAAGCFVLVQIKYTFCTGELDVHCLLILMEGNENNSRL